MSRAVLISTLLKDLNILKMKGVKPTHVLFYEDEIHFMTKVPSLKMTGINLYESEVLEKVIKEDLEIKNGN